ncbi:aspartate kinase [Thalassotalea sp. HSM 43]|uniref:aspartate kinase n=1 Tax=Thalassotalea sp. HSM 43 TaxID=2552945 RepID=UPI0010801FEF|nr:aspartate kinase [Thalassotalea sp. HSM 43]QBY05104.1 aspartate kinase [Thalassotalea sp. HSM 43]
MAIVVQKYGGTSVGSPSRIEKVAEQIIATKNQGHSVVVVVSAMAGDTNRLVDLASQVDQNPSPRELDMLLAAGEQVSISLLSMALIKRGYSAISLLAHQAGIHTNNRFNKARIKDIDTRRMLIELQQGHVVVVAGFQGMDSEGNVTTLGRGGSDTTAVAIASALRAKECQIFTDVDGVYTTDPRIEASAKKLDHVSFEEMLEMASCGAKVLQPRAVEFAGQNKMPLRVLSSFTDGDSDGTQICYEPEVDRQHPVTAIACQDDEILFSVKSMLPLSELRTRLFAELAEADVEIDMISHQANAQSKDLNFTIARKDLVAAEDICKEFVSVKLISAYHCLKQLSKVSVIGNGMRSHCGVAAGVFATLQQQAIDVFLVSTAEIKLSVLMKQGDAPLAISSLTKKFNLND